MNRRSEVNVYTSHDASLLTHILTRRQRASPDAHVTTRVRSPPVSRDTHVSLDDMARPPSRRSRAADQVLSVVLVACRQVHASLEEQKRKEKKNQNKHIDSFFFSFQIYIIVPIQRPSCQVPLGAPTPRGSHASDTSMGPHYVQYVFQLPRQLTKPRTECSAGLYPGMFPNCYTFGERPGARCAPVCSISHEEKRLACSIRA